MFWITILLAIVFLIGATYFLFAGISATAFEKALIFELFTRDTLRKSGYVSVKQLKLFDL